MAASPERNPFALTGNRGLAPRFLFLGGMLRRWTAVLPVALFAFCSPRHIPSHTPRRIVSFAPNVTEMIYAMGEGGRLVGVDDSSDFPPPVRALPRVGRVQPDVERITALRTDLVIANAAGLAPSLRAALGAVSIPLLVVRNDRLLDVTASMRAIGTAIGAPGAADATRAIERQLASQRRTRLHPPRILLAVWTDPLYVAGTGSFADDLFRLVGARNAVEVRGWPQYSLESFVAAPPDILLVPDRSVTPAQAADLLRRAHVSAAVFPVDENVFTRPGPRVGQAAAELNRIVDLWEKRSIVRRSPPG